MDDSGKTDNTLEGLVMILKKRMVKQLIISLLILLLLVGRGITVFAVGDDVTIRLNKFHSDRNIPFAVENMFPGDSHTKEFVVQVSHQETITLYSHADIRPGYETLAEVLMVTVQLPEKGITLYDGLMREMPTALEYKLAAEEKEVLYRITVYLDTGAGNEYQYQSLIADVRWWYAQEEDGVGGGQHPSPDTPAIPDTPDTGDHTDMLSYMGLAGGSVLVLILLFIVPRKKKQEEKTHE